MSLWAWWVLRPTPRLWFRWGIVAAVVGLFKLGMAGGLLDPLGALGPGPPPRGQLTVWRLFPHLPVALPSLTPSSDRPIRPLAGVLVVVDPGHGGPDRGACHLPSGLVEKEINVDMALRLEQALTANGAQVVLTRRDDTFLSLDARAQLANERGADVFLSLHVNRYPSPECFGAQTFYLPTAPEGRRLALLIQEELLRVYPPNYRQALPGNYRVLRGTRMPAALVEIGFVTNATDRALLQQDDYRQAVAAAIVRGVIRFVQGESADQAAQGRG